MTAPTALVTGGNRGIGLEVVRQLAGLRYRVSLGSRDAAAGERAASGAAGDVRALRLDVTDGSSIDAAAAAAIAADVGALDALVNNAALHDDTWQSATDPDFAIVGRTGRTSGT